MDRAQAIGGPAGFLCQFATGKSMLLPKAAWAEFDQSRIPITRNEPRLPYGLGVEYASIVTRTIIQSHNIIAIRVFRTRS